MRSVKTYKTLLTFNTFAERLKYAMTFNKVCDETFGYRRYLNQKFYTSKEWADLRNYVIARDNGCDLAMPGYEIMGTIYVHHLTPLIPEDILKKSKYLLNPEFLVCVSFNTHQAITYGDLNYSPDLIVRKPNDTCPWKR